MEWQPMKSAPAKGERFLAITRGGDQFVCQWGDQYAVSMKSGRVYGWINSHGSIGNTANPYRWQPLPPPPEDTTK